MLMPKRVKRRKQFRGSMAGKALRGISVMVNFDNVTSNVQSKPRKKTTFSKD